MQLNEHSLHTEQEHEFRSKINSRLVLPEYVAHTTAQSHTAPWLVNLKAGIERVVAEIEDYVAHSDIENTFSHIYCEPSIHGYAWAQLAKHLRSNINFVWAVDYYPDQLVIYYSKNTNPCDKIPISRFSVEKGFEPIGLSNRHQS